MSIDYFIINVFKLILISAFLILNDANSQGIIWIVAKINNYI